MIGAVGWLRPHRVRSHGGGRTHRNARIDVLPAGRKSMPEAAQALSVLAGDKLLTTANAGDDKDPGLSARLGFASLRDHEPMRVPAGALGGRSRQV
jgi:hypothetical protein